MGKTIACGRLDCCRTLLGPSGTIGLQPLADRWVGGRRSLKEFAHCDCCTLAKLAVCGRHSGHCGRGARCGYGHRGWRERRGSPSSGFRHVGCIPRQASTARATRGPICRDSRRGFCYPRWGPHPAKYECRFACRFAKFEGIRRGRNRFVPNGAAIPCRRGHACASCPDFFLSAGFGGCGR